MDKSAWKPIPIEEVRENPTALLEQVRAELDKLLNKFEPWLDSSAVPVAIIEIDGINFELQLKLTKDEDEWINPS